MKKLLYIDACIRENLSRTKKIADPIIKKLAKKYEITTLCLNNLNIYEIQKEETKKRINGEVSKITLEWANLVKNADRIVIAAPFWDMSIPAALKVFFELVSIIDVTFKSNNITCYGNCNCEKLLFITTRGMNIDTGDKLDQATSYLYALGFLWGFKEIIVLARKNFDYISLEEINSQIDSAISEGLKICDNF